MKSNKIFRGICYVVLPLLIALFLISIFYVSISAGTSYTSIEDFFESEEFAFPYMNKIESYMNTLIYADNGWETIQDGKNTIYQYGSSYTYGMHDFDDFLIIYGNKVLTNIKFTDKTNTVESIKSYILEKNKNFISYENNKFSSNSKAFYEERLLDFFDRISITYYSKNGKNSPSIEEFTYYNENDAESDINIENSNSKLKITETVEEVPDVVDSFNTSETPEILKSSEQLETHETSEMLESVETSETSKVQYYTAHLEDFTFYSSYNPELTDGSDVKTIISVMQFLKPYEQILYIIMPISAILTLIIFIYLINSIGHVKNKEEIVLSDFDKVPIEGIIIVFAGVVVISILILDDIPIFTFSVEMIVAIVLTIFLVNFILLELLFITSVARIKAKKFLDTCLCGRVVKWAWRAFKKIIRWCLNLLKKFKENIKEVKKCLNNNIKLTWRLILIAIAVAIGGMILIGCFGSIGFAILMGIYAYLVYGILLRIENFQKIENSLKNIYDGEKVTLYVSDFTNEFEKSVEYINDISNGFENAVEESLKSERLKTELITNVSHDIKTPLTSIINYVDLIKKENIQNEKVKEYIGILDDKSQRLKKLTEDLVEASKVSSGNVSLNLEEINIVELLNQAFGEFKDKFQEKNLEIISEMPKEILKIRADSRYMYRVIENLFGNVSKYALDNSRVYVEAKLEGNKVKFAIKNISKDRLNITEEELMQRFVRGDKSRTTEGSGLGLAIARSLIELQKGNLTCKIDGDLFKVEIEFDII